MILLIAALILFMGLLIALLSLFRADTRLHRARFARTNEVKRLLFTTPQPGGLLLGKLHVFNLASRFVCITPQPERKELGNLLLVAPTRAGKGLLATSQLLTWQHSMIVNDIKGDLFTATAGYRSKLGKVYVLDPTGRGNRYDPLAGKQTEDALYSAAASLLYQAHEGEGAIFTQRAAGMLAQLFAGARKEQLSPFPYVRHLIHIGLAAAAERLNTVSPQLATQFLDVQYADANFSDRFLLSAWGTLTARMRPLLTETVIRTLTHTDFQPADLLTPDKPITIYLRWPEQHLLALSPLVRLLWGTLIDELITTYDNRAGKNCNPVLLLIDEAGRTAIPTLAEHATTAVGRGIYLWIAIQSLSQLEAAYGKAHAQILRDNMDSQLYYRPTDLATAKYLEDRLGSTSAYAHSTTSHDGEETSQGETERAIPLLSAQEILQMKDADVLGFHRNLPPFQMQRIDFRTESLLKQRMTLPAPTLPVLPSIEAIPDMHSQRKLTDVYIDPDGVNVQVIERGSPRF